MACCLCNPSSLKLPLIRAPPPSPPPPPPPPPGCFIARAPPNHLSTLKSSFLVELFPYGPSRHAREEFKNKELNLGPKPARLTKLTKRQNTRHCSVVLCCFQETISTLRERSDLDLQDKVEVPSVYTIMTRSWPIYLYVPNIIGYLRILSNLIAFGASFTNKTLFVVLYLISFVCDELDGRFARLLNQTSTFGAVLDMVTDRVSTAGLLVVLSHCYKRSFGLFLGLLALDIASHWLQMYSTFLANKTSHKDVADSKSKLLRAYYRHRLFMGYCCVGAEVLYLILYVLAEEHFNSVIEVVKAAAAKNSPWLLPGLLALPGWAIKQWVNLVQARNAADVCVLYDMQKSKSN